MKFFEPITEIELHAFGEASRQGVGAAVFGAVLQPSGLNTQLIASKGRLANKDLSTA